MRAHAAGETGWQGPLRLHLRKLHPRKRVAILIQKRRPDTGPDQYRTTALYIIISSDTLPGTDYFFFFFVNDLARSL